MGGVSRRAVRAWLRRYAELRSLGHDHPSIIVVGRAAPRPDMPGLGRLIMAWDIERAIANLPSVPALAISLYYVAAWPVDDIAAVLRLSVRATYRRMAEGLDEMARMLDA